MFVAGLKTAFRQGTLQFLGNLTPLREQRVRFPLSAFVIVVAPHAPGTTLVSNQSQDVTREISLVEVLG